MNRLNRFTKIRISSIFAALVLFSCLNISYLNSKLGSFANFLFPIRIIEILLIAVYLVGNKRKTSNVFLVITVYVFYLMIRTKLCGEDCIYALKQLSLPYTIAIYLEWIGQRENCFDKLKVWRNILTILVFLDFFSMIIYPNGLYASDMYSKNWFLGYKSARLPFLFAMLSIDTCIDITENGNVSRFTWVSALIACYELWKSDSMGALAGLIILFGGILVSNSVKEKSYVNRIICNVLDYKCFLPIYGVIVFLTVIVQNSGFILYIVQNVFHRDPTLTTRTMAWVAFVKMINKNPWFGYGFLPTEQYQSLANNIYVTSAHNMVLSLLLTGGFVGTIIYILIIILSTRKNDKIYSANEEVCIWGILGFLLVGITSSAVVFSQFGFLFYSLLELNRKLQKE